MTTSVTRLYRTVSVPEHDDLHETGAYRYGGGAEDKHFWRSHRDAARFGLATQGHYHPDGYRVVAADVPEEVVQRSEQFPMLDGIGPAVFVGLDDLDLCALIFLDPP